MSRVRAFSGHGFLGLGPVLNPSVASYPRSFSPQLPRLGSVPGTTIPKSASMSLSLPVPASDQPSSAATDTTNSSRRVRGRFPCAYCTKVFKRGEHRTRHERSHTHEKPFACSYCHKKYARKDLVTRHERTLHRDRQQQDYTTRGPPEHTDNNPVPAHGSSQQSQPHGNQDSQIRRELCEHAGPPVQPSLVGRSGGISFHPPIPTAGISQGQQIHEAQFMTALHQPSTASVLQSSGSSTLLTSPSVSLPTSGDVPSSLPAAMDSQDFERSSLPIDGLQSLNGHSGTQFEQGMSAHAATEPLHVTHLTDFDFGDFFGRAPEIPLAVALPDDGVRTTWFLPNESSLHDIAMQLPPTAVAERNLDSVAVSLEQTDGTIAEDNLPSGQARFKEETKRKNRAALKLSEHLYSRVRQSLVEQTSPGKEQAVAAPSRKACEASLNSYYDHFHQHLPVIHPSTVLSDTAPVPLVMAMLCIGSLHRLDRRRARRFYEVALSLAENVSLWRGPLACSHKSSIAFVKL